MMARWIPVLMILAAVPPSSSFGAEESARGECVTAGRPARLGGCVHRTDATGAARLFFRDAGERHWYFVEATNENGCAWGVVPAPGTRLDRVAYYVEIATADGSLEKSRERTARVVRHAGQCTGRMLPSSNVEPAFVGATAGAPLTPGGFGPHAIRGGAPVWVMGAAAAVAAGGAAVALRSDSAAGGEPPAAPREPTAAPPTLAPTPGPTSTPAPPPEPRRATATPQPVVEPPSEPPPPPPPPEPTAKPTATPKPEPTPKPTKTPKPRGGGDDLAISSLQWRSDLQVPGATGRLAIAGKGGSAAETAAGRSQGLLAPLEPGENRLEIAVAGATGPGIWRVTLGAGLQAGTLRVLAGTVTVEGDDTLVLALRGQPIETALVAFRSR